MIELMMKALTSSSSKLIVDKYRESGSFVSQKELLLNRPELCSIKSQKVVNFRFLQLVSLEHKAIHPVASFTLSSKTQVLYVAFCCGVVLFFGFLLLFLLK